MSHEDNMKMAMRLRNAQRFADTYGLVLGAHNHYFSWEAENIKLRVLDDATFSFSVNVPLQMDHCELHHIPDEEPSSLCLYVRMYTYMTEDIDALNFLWRSYNTEEFAARHLIAAAHSETVREHYRALHAPSTVRAGMGFDSEEA